MYVKRELTVIGLLKTWMMLLVVLYHSAALWSHAGWFNQAPQTSSMILPVLTEYMNDIHIYIFAFASGYLFYYSNFIKKSKFDIKNVIKKRSAKLLVPYVIVTIFWLLPFELFYFRESAWELFNRFVLGTAPRQLWFLLMLWGANIIFCLWIQYVKKKLPFKAGMLLLYVIYVIGALLIRIGIPNYFQVFTVMRYLLFFFFGYALCRKASQIFQGIHTAVIAVVHLFLFSVVYFLNYFVDHPIKLLSLFITPFVSLTGIVLYYKIADYVVKKKKTEEKENSRSIIISLFRQNEFAVYLFHQQWIWIVMSYMNKPYIPPILIVLIGFVVSVVFSVLMSIGLKRVPKLKYLLAI